MLCTSSVLDADNNNLTLNNLIEQINVSISNEDLARKQAENSRGYVVPIQVEITSRLRKLREEVLAFDLKFEFLNPKKEIIVSLPPTSYGIKKEVKNIRIRSKISPLPFDQNGEYTFAVYLKESGDSDFVKVDEIPLEVNLKIPEQK